MTVDFLFVVDALAQTGFGHAARCLSLARLIRSRFPAATVAFQGQFSPSARHQIQLSAPHVDQLTTTQPVKAGVIIVDRMADPWNMDAADLDLAAALADRGDCLIHICSGTTPPLLPPAWTIIGYQPGGPPAHPPHVFWGLDFAPTDLPGESVGLERQRNRLLIALGGYLDHQALVKSLHCAAELSEIQQIDVLLSPALGTAPPDVSMRHDQSVRWHRNVPSVAPLIAEAGTVVASTGNLAYEAMALGAAVCLIGQKDFQVTLGRSFADLGLARCAGHSDTVTVEQLTAEIRHTLDGAVSMGARAKAAVPLDGLARMLGVIAARAGRS